MKKLKSIAIIGTRGLPARYGGFETIAECVSRELRSRGFDVYVSCETKPFKTKVFGDHNGVRLVHFPIIESIRNFSEPAMYDLLSVLWFSSRVDFILMLGTAFPLVLIPARLLGRKVFLNVDGLEWKRRKFRRPLNSLLKQFEKLSPQVANQIIVDSQLIGAYYHQNYGVIPYYVPSGVEEVQPFEPETLMKYNLSPHDYYLVVARLEPENNISLILQEFKHSRSKKKLVIVGPLKNSDYVKGLLRNNDDRVLFLGGVFETRLQRTLRYNCFAYIHGHEVGGTNPSLVEALSCRNVILAFDCQYNREVAEDAGIYFNETVGDLSGKIENLEVSQDQLAEKALLAYSLYKRKFTIEKMIDSLESLMRRFGS